LGGTVAGWHVLAEFAGRGDEVLSLQGEVLEAVTRQLSSAIAEREAQVVAVKKEFNDDRDRFAQLQDVVLLRRSLSRD
jgi:hypothetical protein